MPRRAEVRGFPPARPADPASPLQDIARSLKIFCEGPTRYCPFLLRCRESPCLILVKGRLMASGEEGLFDFLPEQAVPERVGAGVPRLRFAERMQTRWRPVSLDGLLPDDHRVRLVWSFVEGLDVTALLATIKAVDGRPGHPPADPRILLALWLYATVEGIGSAREVARLCDEHIAFEWLCGGVG